MPPAHDRNQFTWRHLQMLSPSDPHISTECPICQEPYNDTHIPVRVKDSLDYQHGATGCNHVFGKECIFEWMNSGLENSNRCPICRVVWYPNDTDWISGFEINVLRHRQGAERGEIVRLVATRVEPDRFQEEMDQLRADSGGGVPTRPGSEVETREMLRFVASEIQGMSAVQEHSVDSTARRSPNARHQLPPGHPRAARSTEQESTPRPTSPSLDQFTGPWAHEAFSSTPFRTQAPRQEPAMFDEERRNRRQGSRPREGGRERSIRGRGERLSAREASLRARENALNSRLYGLMNFQNSLIHRENSLNVRDNFLNNLQDHLRAYEDSLRTREQDLGFFESHESQ